MITTQNAIKLTPLFSGKRKERKEKIEKSFQAQLPELNAERQLKQIEALERQREELPKRIEQAHKMLEAKMEALPELEETDLPEETKVLLSNVDDKKLEKLLIKKLRKTVKLNGEDKFLTGFTTAPALLGLLGLLAPPFLIFLAFLPLGGSFHRLAKNIGAKSKLGNAKPERLARIMIAEGVITEKDLKKIQKKD